MASAIDQRQSDPGGNSPNHKRYVLFLRQSGLAQSDNPELFEPLVKRRRVPIGVLPDRSDCRPTIVVAPLRAFVEGREFGGGMRRVALETVDHRKRRIGRREWRV